MSEARKPGRSGRDTVRVRDVQLYGLNARIHLDDRIQMSSAPARDDDLVTELMQGFGPRVRRL